MKKIIPKNPPPPPKKTPSRVWPLARAHQKLTSLGGLHNQKLDKNSIKNWTPH